MNVKRQNSLKCVVRDESWGTLVYLPDIDQFVALVERGGNGSSGGALEHAARRCVAEKPTGPYLAGPHNPFPVIAQTMVLNVITSPWCELKCVYCHADDLMIPHRKAVALGVGGLDPKTLRLAIQKIEPMVVVLSGGDPLANIGHTRRLLDEVPTGIGVVIDTSGVGDATGFVESIGQRPVHLRISLDSTDPKINRALRPHNGELRIESGSRDVSYDGAMNLVDAIANIPTISFSIQSVITTRNEHPDEVEALHRFISGRGADAWTVHAVAPAGKAAEVERNAKEKRRGGLRPTSKRWRLYLEELAQGSVEGIRIRITDASEQPNSVVLLGSDGVLKTEGVAVAGKATICSDLGTIEADALQQRIREAVDLPAHLKRYLSMPPWTTLEDDR